MTSYPVHYRVDRAERFTRLQLAARFVAFLALGMVGISFGAVFVAGYLGLPAFAAARLSREANGYTQNDAPRIVSGLRWFAAVAAWAGLIAEHLPSRAADEQVAITIEGHTSPTAASALWRVVTGLPSALVLAVLCWIGVLVWLWAALSILVGERVGPRAFDYLVGLQRWSIRLLAYQASLVDTYPPFSFADSASPPAAVALSQ